MLEYLRPAAKITYKNVLCINFVPSICFNGSCWMLVFVRIINALIFTSYKVTIFTCTVNVTLTKGVFVRCIYLLLYMPRCNLKVWLILMSKRVCSSEKVANKNTEACFLLINCNSKSPCNMANWSKMERRILIGPWVVQILRYRPRSELCNDNRWDAPFISQKKAACYEISVSLFVFWHHIWGTISV